MISRDWPAPAKLNLCLRILGRRSDGYHELQTAFQLLDHGDSLDFTPRRDGVIRRVAGPHSVPPEEDLSLRAARSLQAATGTPLGVDIAVHKRIPMQAGLGGGSSDAATVLVALNRIWNLGLEPARLAGLGQALGADVPVFVHGQSAWGEGRGERLTPLALPTRYFAVVTPNVAVRTADVFQAPELTRDSAPTTIRSFLKAGGGNDCTAVVLGRYPEVRRALDWLGRKGAARLTGTGSSVFAEFADAASAQAALAGLPAGWQGFAARGVARSPLLERLAAERDWGVAKW